MVETRTTITIDEEIWKKFVAVAVQKFGPKVGEAKKKALEEAIKEWLSKR